jgi:hypothetical protein
VNVPGTELVKVIDPALRAVPRMAVVVGVL